MDWLKDQRWVLVVVIVLPSWNPTYTVGAIAAVLNWFGETFPGTTGSVKPAASSGARHLAAD